MANEIYQTILTNQNAEYRANKAQRESIDTQLTRALSSLDTLANRVYGYTHTAVVTDDLEKDYQDIITANPDLANVSAVGLLAILSDGNTVSAQGNRMFINGTEEQTDYSFSGENSQSGIEFVKIWYFQNSESQLTLQESFDYIIVSANVRQIETVNINASYLNYINTITIDGGFVPPANSSVKTVVDNYGVTVHLPKLTEIYRSPRIQIGGTKNEQTTFASLDSTYKMKTAYLPELTNIFQTSFWACTPIENIYCPNLKSISNNAGDFYASFKRCPNLVFTVPAGCESITGYCFSDDMKGIILECKDAAISNNWANVLTSLTIFEMCSDWGASINISKPAGLASWSMAKYIDLMTDKLRDMTLTEETRTLTIPSAMLTSLQADTDGLAAIEAATDKGWTIGGA